MAGGASDMATSPLLLHQLLERQAAKTPSNTALEFFPSVRMTYCELNEASNRLARYIRAHHAPGKKVVGLCLEKSHKAIIAVLATLKAGMAWLPLPMDAPPSRIEQIFQVCDMGLVLFSKDTAKIVLHMSQCIQIDDVLASPELQALQGSDLEETSRNSDDLCHILFTSGSTGTPKGVMLEHRAVMHNVRALVKEFALNEQTRTLQFAAMTFDIFSLDVFMTLACGGCLFMAPLSEIIGDLTSSMHKAAITYAQLTPTIILLIDPAGVPGLQTLVSSGEALPQRLANHWRHRIHLFNAYGPTETIVCTTQKLSGSDVGSACIGHAIPGLDVCILAEQAVEEVREGEVGEICVAGPQLFRGYISSLKGIQSSECYRRGSRYYRTGDLGRWETVSSGRKVFTCLGRKDGQVKVHGIRVDLGDVETSILIDSSIEQCAVVLPQSGSCAGRLCSIIVLCSPLITQPSKRLESYRSCEAGLTTEYATCSLQIQVAHEAPRVLSALANAKSGVKTRLPTHAIPTNWWVILEMPLTSSGKIDRTKLRTWIEDMERQTYLEHVKAFSGRSEHPIVPSVNSQGRLLQSLWSQVLGRPASSLRTDVSFIELGADSLDVIQFIAKARKTGLKFDLSQVHTARTIEGLAHIPPSEETSSKHCADSSYVPFSILPRARPLGPILEDVAATCGLQVGKIEDVYPCTPYQSGLMALDLKSPMSYVCAFSWTLLQGLDIDSFRAAWNDLLASEPVLRNRLIWDATSQEFWQVTVRHEKCEWSIEDFESPMSLGHTLCRGFVSQDAATRRWKFQLKIHHSIIDGWSLKLMLNRLKSMYYREESERPVAAPFTHFIRFRLEESNRQALASKEFWNRYLMDFSPSDFLAVQADSSHDVHANSRLSLSVPINMREVATRYEVTPATMLCAAVALVLGAHGDTSDVSFGLILTGRDAPVDGIYEMVGPSFAIIPFRTSVERQASTARLLKTIARQVIDMMPHQHYGLQQIKRCGTGAAAACELQCLVVVQPEDENLAGKGLWEEIHGQTSGLADSVSLSLELVLDEDQVVVNCNFDPVYLPRNDGKVLLDHLSGVLRSFQCMDPEDIVAKVGFGEYDDQSRALDWAQSNGSPNNACLHEIIQPCFEKYSENIAIEDQSTQRQYTYRELDDLSGRLSRLLYTDYGAGPEVVVPVAMDKSAMAVITILAILKAGSAYVPIDTTWPLERVRHIVKETRATVILCSHAGANIYRGLAVKVVEICEDTWKDVERNSIMADAMTDASPSNLAVLMYTSGSTGVPKGVMLEHRALSTSLTHLVRVCGLAPGTRHLQYSSLIYDVSISDVFIPLLSGACICVPDEYNRVNRLTLTMKEMAIESVDLTPSIADLISPEDVITLNTITIGGEMMKKSLIETWAPRVRMVNSYGPTEASISTTITDTLDPNADPSIVGRNVTAWHWIVRRELDGEIYAAPTGCIGEIAIAGHVLARGYLHNATLTDQCFVEAPQLSVDRIPSRIYLTGDIGRYDADGQIRIVGRKDRMIKINGIRVEPGESEHQLRQLGELFRSCVVQCVHDTQHVAKLAAFVEVGVSTQEEPPEKGVIVLEPSAVFKTLCKDAFDQLKQLLPIQYVPTLFVPITRMPYLLSGKVDQRRLRDGLQQIPNVSSLFGVFQAAEEQSGEVMPTSPAEIALEAALRQVFVVEQRLCTAANFFYLGGDSFAAIKLVSASRKSGFEISVSHIYNNPTLRALASVAVPVAKTPTGPALKNNLTPAALHISEGVRTELASRYNVSLNQIDDLYPASPFQEGLAAIAIEENGNTQPEKSSTYNAEFTFPLAPCVEVARLNQTMERVISQNPICRTRIVFSSEGTMQVVYKTLHTPDASIREGANLFSYLIQLDENRNPVRLLLSIHHMLYDAWTIDRLLEEINQCYHQPNLTRPASKPYKCFIEYLSTFNKDEASNYWTEQLADTPLTPYPLLDTERRALSTKYVQRKVNLNLEHSKRAGISPATIVAAALALLLSAYCNMEDICYGMTLSGRDDPELEDIAGPTISTVPMRIRIKQDEPVASFVEQIQRSLLAMRQYQHYGLQNIARLPVDGARNACKFRNLLVIQQSLQPSRADMGNNIVQDCITEETSMYLNYPLIIVADVYAATGKATLRLEYDPVCLQKLEVDRFGQQLEHIITQCTLLTGKVSEVEVVTAVDRRQILAWNPSVPKASFKHLHHLFDELARKQPECPAIESTSGTPTFQRLSYRQLNEHAANVCRHIETVASESTVLGVCFQKSPIMVITMLAIWRAGRAVLVLDPLAPVNRLRSMLSDMSKGDRIITEPSQVHLFDSSKVIVLDPSNPALIPTGTEGLSEKHLYSREQPPNAADTAYILYTSGSSGTPKGVVVSHSAIATALVANASTIGLNQQTRMFQFSAFTFDASILETFGTLINGGCVCMPSESERLGGALTDVIRRFRVNQLNLTPTVAEFLDFDQIPALKGLVLVGEPSSHAMVEKWKAKKALLRIMNGYGPTEASVQCSVNVDLLKEDVRNIGYAVGCNMFITVPSDETRLAAIGTIGEVVICGNTVANGYLNKPELTTQVFGVNLPWMSRPKDTDLRYYRTGDLARYTSDGSMVFLGRKDLQSKIHGQRIELAEIEWHIERCGNFSGCMVDVIHPDLLVAFVVITPSQQGPHKGPLPVEKLPQDKVRDTRTFLRSVLPTHMIPAIYVPVNNWPVTVSGKIDRRRLRESVKASINSYRSNLGETKRYPQTTTQKILAKVWAEVLSIPEDQIGLDDTITVLGGDSITFIRVIAGARRCRLDLNLNIVYNYSTLETVARSVKTNHSSRSQVADAPTPFSLIEVTDHNSDVRLVSEKCQTSAESILDIYPCTSMQESLMISSTKSPEAYFNQEVFRLAKTTIAPKLVACLQKIWDRHDILRTRIIHDETYRSLQVVIKESVELSYVEQELALYLQQDVSNSPGYGERLSRCAVVVDSQDSYLVISQHHAIFDGWSQSLLFAEIESEYCGEPKPVLPPMKFSSFIRNVVETNNSSDAQQYWEQYLADLEPKLIPQIEQPLAFEANQQYTMQMSLPHSAKHSLATISESAWAIVLGRYSKTEDVTFGTVRSGRTASVDNLDMLFGPTMVTIPRRLRPIHNQRVHDYLQCTDATMAETLPWEQFSHQNIRKLNEGARRACRYSSIIVVHMLPSEVLENEEAIIIPHSVEGDDFIRSDCLTISCQPQKNGELTISTAYDDRVVAPNDARWMTYQFSHVILELAEKNNIRVQDIEMTGPKGITQVQQWNRHPITECRKRVDEIFTERAGNWSTMTAIKASDGLVTYLQLDNRSSKVATSLRKLGVRKGDIVPLFMTRSSAMVVAMLGVLKAGAAYAPLATDLPQGRIRLLLEEIGAQHVVCTSDQVPKLRSVTVRPILLDIERLMTDISEQDIYALISAYNDDQVVVEQKPCGVARDLGKTGNNSELAYVMFTSGSSGTPKGVMIGHGAFATTILENGRQMKYSLGTKTLSFLAYTFDVNVLEIFLTLLHGGCLFIPDADQRLGHLPKYINDHHIEMAFMTPTAVKNLLHAPSEVPSLKVLQLVGEPMPHSILQQWSSSLCLINSYGPTETCVDASRNADIGPTTDPNNIGYPIGTHLWVTEIDSYHRLAPIGCPGELLISGPKLALGYLNDDKRTRQKFIDGSEIPWTLHNETRFYASGDIVRQNSDGSITFIGRKDLQTKLNGVRVEIGEVEVALERCGDIAAAVVVKVAMQDNSSESLIAFFSTTASRLRDGHEELLPPTDDIRRIIHNVCGEASQSLPTSLVPQIYIPLAKIPITASGKTDRNALHRIFEQCSRDQVASYRSSSVQRPTRTIMQRIFQGLWAQVLSLNPNQISLDSQFISLGGESLAAIKLASMCREIGLHLSIGDILQRSRLEDMASYAELGRDSRSSSMQRLEAPTSSPVNGRSASNWTPKEISQITDACDIDETDIEDIYPCTAAQEAMTAVTARFPTAYISREVFRLPGDIDLERFHTAWELVSENNPILRTRICSITTDHGIENVQVVCRCRCAWTETALGLIEDHPSMGLGAPLARYHIIQNQDGVFFAMARHHSIYDGFSAKLIWDDFRYAYTNSARPLPRPSYRQYVDYLSSLYKEEVVKFWAEDLQGYKGEHFPASTSCDYAPQATRKLTYTAETNFQWDDLCPYTFATIARAAWAILLSTRGKVSGPDKDVCFTATLSGRSAPLAGLEHMVGPTINTVPVRVRFNLDHTVDQCLRQIQEHALSMLPFEHLGLGEIRRINDAARDACKSPTLLMVQPAQLQDEVLPAGLTRVEDEERFTETFGLVVECTRAVAHDALSVSALYDPRLLEDKEVGHLFQQFLNMITYLNRHYTDRSTIRSGIWSLVDESNLQQMAEWNPVCIKSPSICLHQLVEKSAELRPRDTAVDAHDGTLTYEELEAAAEALAANLRNAYGIKPGDLVPLCFEKSRSMIVAILGILKSGAGYTPLDTQGPTSRLEHVILKTRAKLVLLSPLQAKTHCFSVPTFIMSLEHLSMPSNSFQRISATPRDIAYVIFTSGTSGSPKGVITEHSAVCLSIQEMGKRLQYDRQKSSLRVLQFCSYTFDVSLMEIFSTLAHGGCLCIPAEEQRMANLEEAVRQMKVNFAFLTPTVANLLEPCKMPTLKGLAVGGEMLNRVLVTKWMSSESPIDVFVNCYGPTEASICCATGVIDATRPNRNGTYFSELFIPLFAQFEKGNPQFGAGNHTSEPGPIISVVYFRQSNADSNIYVAVKTLRASLWIVDEKDINHLVPVSGIGELVISGPTLARGYLDDDRRTKEAFIEGVPWLARIGHSRLYKTGDLARFDAHGNVEILGRKEDSQIKLRGLRIELGEVESAISTCERLFQIEHVAAALVTLDGKPTLSAFIQLPIYDDQTQVAPGLEASMFHKPSDRQRDIANTIVEALRIILPEYMIPKVWILVRSWPLTTAGKTDRRRLMATCEAVNSTIIAEYQESSIIATTTMSSTSITKTEKIIKEVWIDVLRKASNRVIEPEDDFFKLGGDSLDTIKMVSALRSRHIHLDAQEIFRAKTLRRMAEVADSKTSTNEMSKIALSDSSSIQSVNQRSQPTTSTSLDGDSSPNYGAANGNISDISSAETMTSSSSSVEQPSKLSSSMKQFLCESISIDQTYIEDVSPASRIQLVFLIEGQKWCRSYYAWSFIAVNNDCTIARVYDSCQALTNRHAILRTHFHLLVRECYQVVVRGAIDFKVLFYDGSSVQMCERLDKDVERPVSFGKILTRFRLLMEEGTGRLILAIGLSHAQYDGFCHPTILNDLHSGLMGQNSAKLLVPSYNRFIEHTLETSNEDADKFWQETLRDSNITSIVPPAGTTPPVMDHDIIRLVPFKFRHSGHFSYGVISKAAWALVLSRLSRSTDVTFGNLVNGRFAAFEGVQDVVGPCINVIPARVRVDGDLPVRDLLEQIQEQQIAAIPFEATPLDRIARQANWPTSMHFATTFQYQYLPNGDTLDTGVGPPLAGFAVYGGGLLQQNGCWLMAWPEADGQAPFRLGFCGETMSQSRAEAILDLLSKTLHAINNNLDDNVQNILSLPIDDMLHCPQTPCTDARNLPSSSPTVTAALAVIVDRLQPIWTQVLRPLLPPPPSQPDLDTLNPDHNSSFFSLGGDSIAAAEAAWLCSKAGLDLTLQDFMDFPTLALQAALVAGQVQRPEREKPRLKFSRDWKYA